MRRWGRASSRRRGSLRSRNRFSKGNTFEEQSVIPDLWEKSLSSPVPEQEGGLAGGGCSPERTALRSDSLLSGINKGNFSKVDLKLSGRDGHIHLNISGLAPFCLK
jgi:hypothetical protein